MITFNISESLDPNAKGPYLFHKNIISIGRRRGDILIEDSGIIDHHLLLEVTIDSLICYKKDSIEHYLLNGKRTQTAMTLGKGDRLTIGMTSFIIADFSFTNALNKKERVAKNLELIYTEDRWKGLRPIMDKLEEDLENFL